jgi:TonB family protein
MRVVARRPRRVMTAWVVSALAVMLLHAAAGAQQSSSPPIQARDGDLIVIEGDTRVRIVHRREARVLSVYNPAERRLLVMVDLGFAGSKPDGGVDVNYRFHEVAHWPLGERWSGPAVVEEYFFAGEFAGLALGLRTDRGLIQMLGGGRTDGFRDPQATVIAVKGTGRLMERNPESFALTEERLLEQERRGAEIRRNLPAPSTGAATARQPAAGGQPVRVGGNIAKPTQTVHVEAVKPPRAVEAGISGMVIIEATIGTDGSVTDAKVLRSIPLLDEAALAAVKGWKYTPTLLNGVPVPVIMTVTVNFR